MLKLTIFHGSPCRAAATTTTTSPANAAIAPTRWLMLLKRSPLYMVQMVHAVSWPEMSPAGESCREDLCAQCVDNWER